MSDLFHFDGDRKSFEDIGMPNGARTWREHDLMQALGYENEKTFRKVVMRAMQTCLSLNIRTEENFILVEEGYKLTRFACYLVAMNGDPKKKAVAVAQAYFATLADSFQNELDAAESIERVQIREDLTTGIKVLSGTAKRHGVTEYAFFLNEGYRGMYNMGLAQLAIIKGLRPKERLLDRMGKTELAANLFRVTQTDEKIRNENITGQNALERAAYTVGRKVRTTMQELSGVRPEDIPLAPHISDVKRTLKATRKNLQQLDKPTKKRKPKRSPAPKKD